ncbi:hypothetical protein J7E62_25490 [Variovorax paradoxus]|nr:hypothetical protein [Variovorax paradoxus]
MSKDFHPKATPELRYDPDKLSIFIADGRIAAVGGGSGDASDDDVPF